MTVLITGASRGIGAGLAAHYVALGHDVIGTGRGEAAQVQLDVTDPASHRQMAQDLAGRPIDLLVCNAGVYLDKGDALETGYAADLWAQSFATNVTGVFLTIQALLPHLRRAPASKIAIISSTMASHSRAPGGSYIYRSSKAAVLNLGRNLAADWAGLDIAVGIYHPGWVQTDMGGAEADIDAATSAAGLITRFDALSLDHTGVFENYDGAVIPF